MRFWKNPEFLRHVRADLRTTRAATVLGIVLVICLLAWLGCWSAQQQIIEAYRRSSLSQGTPSAKELLQIEEQCHLSVWVNFYRFLIYAQLAVLTFWSLLCCAQSISGERERKTWDFQRATRLSPGEFLVGKLLGEPVVAYAIVLCCVPVTLLAGLFAREGIGDILSAYLLIFSSALFLGLAGLWISNLFETRSRGVGLIGTFGIYLLFAFATTWVDSDFPGAAAFSPLAALFARLQKDHSKRVATLFGAPVSWLTMSLLLYSTFGAWLVLMILRSLKKDFDQVKPLSRWQAVGCVAFLNFTVYALFNSFPGLLSWARTMGKTAIVTSSFTEKMISLNGVFLLAMGLAMISPYDRLKIWWRARVGLKSLLAEDGPPWPWLLISGALGYALFVWGMYAWKNDVGFDSTALLSGLVQSLTVLVFVTRDISFLQWCRLTRMRAPLLKGLLYLGLYYVAAIVVSFVFHTSSEPQGNIALALLTPAVPFNSEVSSYSPIIFVGLSIQIAVTVLILRITASRLKRTSSNAVESASA